MQFRDVSAVDKATDGFIFFSISTTPDNWQWTRSISETISIISAATIAVPHTKIRPQKTIEREIPADFPFARLDVTTSRMRLRAKTIVVSQHFQLRLPTLIYIRN